MTLRLKAFRVPGRLESQRVAVIANGTPVAEWELGVEPFRVQSVDVPAGVVERRQPLRLEFRLPDAASPASLDAGRAVRPLGMAVMWLQVDRLE